MRPAPTTMQWGHPQPRSGEGDAAMRRSGAHKPLDGIRVLEAAMYGFVPSAGAVLAEWGADVIKVEHAVTGDPQRGLRQTGALRVEGDPNPNIEHANRSKRSLGLDMSVPEGKEVLYELARRSDVFLTSFLPGHRKKFGIDVDDIRAVNPNIIYARGSALGPRGAEAEKGGYDMTAFWCRAGTAATITPPAMPGMIGPPGPAYGDTISGTNLAGGVAAALLKRERTGEPSTVDVSLLGSGLWSLGHTVALTTHLGQRLEAPPPGVPGSPINPLVGLYATSDGRYISLVMMQATKFWADVCRHIDRPELADDPRFATEEKIAANTAEAVEILTKAIATRSLAEWSERFATLAGPWAPVQDTLQAARDPQIRANQYMVQAGELELVTNPVQFDVAAAEPGPAPRFAEQTDEILMELGFDWERIIELKTVGAVT
jgi:crotonobetainyl-CoA:carnitine CoA-transferase CaiB-like acyl-CoA transferase